MPALVLSLQKSSWIMPPQLKCWSWSSSWWWSSSWSWSRSSSWWPFPRWQNQCSHCIPEGKEMPPMQGQWLQVLGWTAWRQDVRGRKSGAEQFLTCQFAWAGHSTSKVKRMQKDAKAQNVIWCHLMSSVSRFYNSTTHMKLRASRNDQNTNETTTIRCYPEVWDEQPLISVIQVHGMISNLASLPAGTPLCWWLKNAGQLGRPWGSPFAPPALLVAPRVVTSGLTSE